MRTKLPVSVWWHAILHTAALVRIRPTSYHDISPLQLVFGQEPNFPTLESLVVRYMFQLLHHNAQRWVPKEGWGYMLGMNLVLL
uniref:Putative ovule protein n=1 Tax=Solanum chacoense TaxID=4108 RepID=A0A0V0HM48_SOLCH